MEGGSLSLCCAVASRRLNHRRLTGSGRTRWGAVFQRQHGGSGNQGEIALALTDFLKRPAVTLGGNWDTNFRQQFVILERGLEIAAEKLVGGNDALAGLVRSLGYVSAIYSSAEDFLTRLV